MFGMQRVGDLVWAAADTRTRGFLLGGTAGRTTLAGEGLQHQDGHTHLLSLAVPNLVSYDPAYAYEIAVIIEDGIRRMYKDGESIFYYLTLMNENYEMPAMPDGVTEGILKGMYRFRASDKKKAKARAQLLGSGAILNEGRQGLAHPRRQVRRGDRRLERDELSGAVPGWSRDRAVESPASGREAARAMGHAVSRHVGRRDHRRIRLREGAPGFDRSLDAAPHDVAGTDGFGRSEGRASLRDFFEVDAKFVVATTLADLARDGKIDVSVAQGAIKDLAINPEKPNPAIT
jgi:pyruvate dehydrogenase E1 component